LSQQVISYYHHNYRLPVSERIALKIDTRARLVGLVVD